MTSILSKRFDALRAAGLEQQIELTPGDMRDYAALSEHHYRAQRPATATRVLTLRSRQPTAADRFLNRHDRTIVVGVLVESMPPLCCRLRDHALGGRYQRIGDASMQARALNAEVRCISRVIVHPQWRGLGLAVRLVAAALAEPRSIYTESLAAMGKVHPFFERAGMTAYHRPPHPFDARLGDALRAAGLDTTDLAMLDHTQQRIKALPGPTRHWLTDEIRRWHRTAFRRAGDARLTDRDRLRAAQQRLLCQPVYYLKDNRPLRERGPKE